jgi:hypothetical protein
MFWSSPPARGQVSDVNPLPDGVRHCHTSAFSAGASSYPASRWSTPGRVFRQSVQVPNVASPTAEIHSYSPANGTLRSSNCS